jgi:RimJ/RimL family protein N-acetyltransferase
MRLLYGHDADVERFVSALVPNCPQGFGASRCVGVIDNDGRLVAGWAWHEWNPHAGTIEFSGASTTPKWMTREILHELFAYAFDGIGCQMIVTRNSEHNTRLHRQLKRYGFDRIDIPRLFGRDENGVVWTLTAEQWRAGQFYLGPEGS